MPLKTTSKYPPPKKNEHTTNFRGLKMTLDHFVLIRSKSYNYYKYGIGIYKEFAAGYRGDAKNCGHF